jgi:hypothetical protein
MGKVFNFGEKVEGYSIPVLNEREIRAAAGMLFLLMFISIMVVIFKGDFTPLKYAVILFLVDILVRVAINPKYSPTLILGRLIVANQTPEYVGAKQKKFAWIIGIILASIMFIHLIVMNAYSPITGIICMICLIFLFFEAAFGICLGCKFYSLVYKEKAQYCPGEVCDVKSRQEIQKTSGVQLLIVLLFALFIFMTTFLFKETLSEKPYDIFGIESSTHSK